MISGIRGMFTESRQVVVSPWILPCFLLLLCISVVRRVTYLARGKGGPTLSAMLHFAPAYSLSLAFSYPSCNSDPYLHHIISPSGSSFLSLFFDTQNTYQVEPTLLTFDQVRHHDTLR